MTDQNPANGSAPSREERLIARVRARDKRALQELHAWQHPRLARFLAHLLRRRSMVGEVLNDTMMAVWDGLDRFDGRSALSTWIFAIAYRKAEPMRSYHTLGDAGVPNDPLYRIEPAARLWHLADLHRLSTGRGVTVAVVDTRVDTDQPDLAGQFAAVQDFAPDHPALPETHGTGVAGIIAAHVNNGVGIAGVAPDAASWRCAHAGRKRAERGRRARA